jgi:serine/threonine protein kinase
VKQIGEKMVFLAQTISTTHSGIPINTNIVVKFTRSYSKEAHQICFSYQQSAPEFYSCESLKGGWHMIIMEWLEGYECYNPVHYSLSNKSLIREILENLHAHDFVHGDLRDCNILIHPHGVNPRICLIDFDWSGKENTMRYPAFMNHKEVNWAQGASDFLPLKKKHDLHFLDILEIHF